MGIMEMEKHGLPPANPAEWTLGASLSLNDWDSGRIDITEVARAGIRCIELAWRNDTFDMFDLDNESKCARWIGEARTLGIEIRSLHLPYGPLFDVSATGADESDAAMQRHVRLMRLARDGASGLLFCIQASSRSGTMNARPGWRSAKRLWPISRARRTGSASVSP